MGTEIHTDGQSDERNSPVSARTEQTNRHARRERELADVKAWNEKRLQDMRRQDVLDERARRNAEREKLMATKRTQGNMLNQKPVTKSVKIKASKGSK